MARKRKKKVITQDLLARAHEMGLDGDKSPSRVDELAAVRALRLEWAKGVDPVAVAAFEKKARERLKVGMAKIRQRKAA